VCVVTEIRARAPRSPSTQERAHDRRVQGALCLRSQAARSRIAESLRKLGGSRFDVTSAGFEPHEANPLAVEALARIGLSLPFTGVQRSVFERFKAGRPFDYVIGVCDGSRASAALCSPG
jgi:protein-tyrosine-phosphatase